MTDHPYAAERLARLRTLNLFFAGAEDPSLALCRWLGAPHHTDCPSPGQARTWGKDEWSAWTGKYGYQYQGDTAHNFMWRHPLTLHSIGMAKTSGDFRSPMALATAVRRGIRAFTDTAAALLRTLPDELTAEIARWLGMATIPADASDDALRQIVCAAANDTSFNLSEMPVISGRGAFVPASKVLAVLQRIERDYHWTPRRTLAVCTAEHLEGAERAQAVERALALVKTGDQQVSETLLLNVEDIRDMLRSEEEIETEQRRAAREAMRIKPAKVETARDRLQARVTQHHTAVLEQLRRVEQAAKSAVDRTMLAIQNLPQLELPADLNDPELVQRVRQLEEDLAAATAREQAAEARANDWCERATRASADQSQAQRAEELRAQLQALASLVVETVRGAANMNPFALVNALNALAHEAEAALAIAKPAEPAVAAQGAA